MLPAAAPFEVLLPQGQVVPLVFNSPHSGRAYAADFLAASRLDEWTIRRSEDSYVDELFLPAVSLGAPLMRANFPRAWLDVNREPYELDPKMFSGSLPHYVNVRSVRVAGGLGTIARIVSESEEIYARPSSVDDALARIDQVYKPYHETLFRPAHRDPRRIRGGRADRLPFDALFRSRRRGAAAAGHRHRRPLRHELRRRADRRRRRRSCRDSAIPSVATSPMPAAISPSTTASRTTAFMPCRSR